MWRPQALRQVTPNFEAPPGFHPIKVVGMHGLTGIKAELIEPISMKSPEDWREIVNGLQSWGEVPSPESVTRLTTENSERGIVAVIEAEEDWIAEFLPWGSDGLLKVRSKNSPDGSDVPLGGYSWEDRDVIILRRPISKDENSGEALVKALKENNLELPLEFKILGIEPMEWTPDVVISRHQGLLGNIEDELNIGRAVSIIGEKKVKDLMWFHPKEPKIELDKKINKQLLFENFLKPYFDFRKDVKFRKEDLIEKYQDKESGEIANIVYHKTEDSLQIGSNNWVVSGSKTKDKNTYMANDPHRKVAVPSLRYMTHLIAPGWNVIGGGEPEIPGISIGHNEYGAWGLTVFRTDGEDLYQYKLNPKDPSKYWHKGKWLKFKVIEEEIPVKGESPKKIELNYSIHGPVTYIDKKRNKAYAIKCGWLEPGGSPYLASLRMNQSKSWEEFRDACNYSNIPGENMLWADRDGNIGWQSVGIAPVRNTHSGLVPVMGDGRYEWDNYLPIIDKPNVFNPKDDFFATANQNVTPNSYKIWNAIGFSWSDPYSCLLYTSDAADE